MLRVLCLVLAFVLILVGPTLADKRVALVIGNAAYPSAPLRNPGNDADLMVKALKDAGFDLVTPAKNLDRAAMLEALDTFHDQAEGADIAVVYYSGHGIELDGVDYLIPIDACWPAT